MVKIKQNNLIKQEKGETFYGISKKYGTTVEAIKALNPGVESLKEGDKLKIELPDSYIKDIKIALGDPKKPDGNFSEINKINPLKDKLDELIVLKETYTVSLFLPLMLDKNNQISVARFDDMANLENPVTIQLDQVNSTISSMEELRAALER